LWRGGNNLALSRYTKLKGRRLGGPRSTLSQRRLVQTLGLDRTQSQRRVYGVAPAETRRHAAEKGFLWGTSRNPPRYRGNAVGLKLRSTARADHHNGWQPVWQTPQRRKLGLLHDSFVQDGLERRYAKKENRDVFEIRCNWNPTRAQCFWCSRPGRRANPGSGTIKSARDGHTTFCG
jgi:hypothetical protein